MDTNELLDMMGSGESSPTEIHDAINLYCIKSQQRKSSRLPLLWQQQLFGNEPEVDEPVDTVIDPEPESQEEE